MAKILKNTFVKIPCDLLGMEEVFAFLATVEKLCHHLVVCVGGGSQISQALREEGIESAFGSLGREITDDRGRAIALKILNGNVGRFNAGLAEREIRATVLTPVLEIGGVLCGVLCLVNGDIYTLSAYHGFSQLFVLTTADRLEEKKQQFARFGACLVPQGKIEIVGF